MNSARISWVHFKTKPLLNCVHSFAGVSINWKSRLVGVVCYTHSTLWTNTVLGRHCYKWKEVLTCTLCPFLYKAHIIIRSSSSCLYCFFIKVILPFLFFLFADDICIIKQIMKQRNSTNSKQSSYINTQWNKEPVQVLISPITPKYKQCNKDTVKILVSPVTS